MYWYVIPTWSPSLIFSHYNLLYFEIRQVETIFKISADQMVFNYLFRNIALSLLPHKDAF